MSGDTRARAMTDLVSLFGIGPAPVDGAPASDDPTTSSIPERPFPTMALGKFLDALKDRAAPVLLDLGAVVGANVAFFGEQLGCKPFVEDLFADLDRVAAEGATVNAGGAVGDADPLQAAIASRIIQEADSVDGVLCWDIMEHLTAPAAQTLATSLTRVLRPRGVLLASFGNERRQAEGHTNYEIVSRSELRHHFQGGTARQLRVLQSREVIQMFEELTVAESFLLKTQAREVIFRKSAEPS